MIGRSLLAAVALVASGQPLGAQTAADGPPARYDVVIRGGRVVDGTGAPWYYADIGVREGRIAAIGRIDSAQGQRVIDASGQVVSPGFIDLMGQTAHPFLQDPANAINLLTQGVTTINTGEGGSSAPLSGNLARAAGWTTTREFLAKLDSAGLPINMTANVGHTQVRQIVIGDVDRQATPAEMERMKDLVREAMEAGAVGISTSLIYPPAVYASEAEITGLAKVAGRYGGAYYTHMRNEGDRLLEAIEEALRIGRAAGTPVHIFHLKAAGQGNWPKMDLALARIKAARAAGQQVAADIYPYVNNGLPLASFLNPRHAAAGRDSLLRRLADPATRAVMRHEIEATAGWENFYTHVGRDWDRVIITRLPPEYQRFSGQSLAAAARALNRDVWDLFFELAAAGASALPETMSEANKIKAMREEFTSFDTDAGPVTHAARQAHPRGYGTFPRLLSRYVRDLGVLSLEQMVHRMSAVAANEIMAYDRGRIAPGLAADVVVFDPVTIRDRSTFAEPTRLAEGVRFVLVNGVVVLADGQYTGARPGRVLRGPGYRPPTRR